jgi:hypothetical protein
MPWEKGEVTPPTNQHLGPLDEIAGAFAEAGRSVVANPDYGEAMLERGVELERLEQG